MPIFIVDKIQNLSIKTILICILSPLYTTVVLGQTHCKMDALIFVLPDFCNTNNFILYAQHSGPHVDPVTYYWSTTEITENITVPGTAGTYTVTVTDNVGCTATDEVTISDPSQFFYIIEGYNLCEGQQGQLIINWGYYEPPPGVTYAWSTGDNTPVINIAGPGTYSVTLTDPATGCSVVVTENIMLIPAPVPVISGTTTICSGNTGTLTVSGGPFSSVYWDPDGWTTETVTITQPGFYTVTAYNADGCSASDTFEVLSSGDLPILDGPNTLCPGQTATLSVTNASLFTTFNWSDGSMTSSITINAAGLYTVTVTDSGGCSAIGSINVLDNSFVISGLETPNTSCTTPNGMIDVSVTPAGTYTYAWSNGATSEDINNLMAGSYTVIVTDASSCSNLATFTVSENVTNPSLSTVITDATCGLSNGNIDLSVTPSGIYTFSWSNGATSEDINNLSIGTYIVTVTGSNGCTATLSAIINNVNSSFAITSNITPNTSCTTPNGTIDITVTPAGTYNYAWSNGATSQDINNLMAGSYTVIVTDATSCSNLATFMISENVTNPSLSTVITNATCGLSNGNIDLSVTPTGIYTFSWSNGATSEDINNLSAGTYIVTVTGSNGCNATLSAIVNNINSSFAITSNITPNTSCTSPNGMIDVSVTPTGTYIYAWSNGATSEDINNLMAGSYTVIVTDASSCSNLATFTVSENVTNPSLSTVITDATCGLSNGNIDLSVTPSGIYTFSWSNGATSEDINNLSIGTYIVTVTGSNGCTATLSSIINNVNSSFAITSNITLNTSCTTPNGIIDVSVTPAGTYTYAWSNGASSEDINNLMAGSYTVIVTDAASCSSSATFTVNENVTNPSLSAVIKDASCGLSNGNIDLSVTPAVAYTFSWSNGATSEDISNLSSGTYMVTVTGSNGCTATLSAIINKVNSFFAITSNITLNTSCTSPNGMIDVSVTPTGTYTYAWSNGATSQDLNNLMAGSYTVIVTDAASCSSSATFTVNENVTNPSLSTVITDATCGLSNGNIDLSVIPSGIYTFSWSNGATSEDINNLSAGTYIVTATGSNGCTATLSAIVNNVNSSFAITSNITPNTSCTSPNGMIDLSVTPTGTYTYTWSNGATSEDINNMMAGSYTVIVTDATSCSNMATFTVNENVTNPSLSTVITDASCGLTNGNIDLSVTPSGIYTFTWSNGATSEDINNLSAGTYIVTVTGSNGCTATLSAIVNNVNSSFAITSNITQNTSCTTPNGMIDVSVTPIGSYIYAWSNGATSQDINNLMAGSYTVIVTDATSCSSSATFTVSENMTNLIVELKSHSPECGQTEGRIEVVSPSTFEGLSFSINGGVTFSALTHIQKFSPGNYVIIIQNLAGCTSIQTITIPEIPQLQIQPINDIELDFDIAKNITIDIFDFPINEIDTIIWTPDVGLYFADTSMYALLHPTLLNTPSGVYTITIIAKNGCSASASLHLRNKTTLDIYAPNIINPHSNSSNNTFYLISKPNSVKNIRSLRIYDRWGNMVFENKNILPDIPAEGWSGDFQNQLVNPAVFVWVADIEFLNGTTMVKKGDVTVIR